MIMSGSTIKKIRGTKWKTTFEADDVYNVLDDVGPLNSVYYAAEFSLGWLVSKIFKTRTGKPLMLEAFQLVLLDMLWYKKYPMVLASRGAGKTFMLALYCVLRAMLVPGSKIVIVGAGFRQAKLVFKYIEELWAASPIIQEAVGNGERPKYGSDAATLKMGLSSIMAIPIGDGEKIRGIRSTVLVADEFSSIPEEIFDIVIEPFSAVHQDPAERAATARFVKRLRELGADERLIDIIQGTQDFGNQMVLSGTPSDKQNHFYKRYCVYQMFIGSQGDPKKLKRALEERSLYTTGRADNVEKRDVEAMCRIWHQYAIFQLPYYGLPDQFLDEDAIRSARASFPKYRFEMEYEAKFPDDSDGFIKRSWIARATPRERPGQPDNEVPVPVELYGDPRATYVMGLDPARHNDNFGCVVLKLTDRGKELVYSTAWDKTDHSVSVDKIREICWRFPIAYIAMDKGGGGDDMREWLRTKTDTVRDQDLIWVIPDQIPKFEDDAAMGAPGRKILELVDFTPKWISDAAHSVASSIEQRNILFPYKAKDNEVYNQYMRHFGEDKINDATKIKLDEDIWGLDDWETGGKPKLGIMQHVDEVVNETCAIVRTVTPNGTEQFMLPKLAEQPMGTDMRRRDRWSALMLANYAAKVYLGHGHRPDAGVPGMARRSTVRRGSPTARGVVRRGGAVWFNPNES